MQQAKNCWQSGQKLQMQPKQKKKIIATLASFHRDHLSRHGYFRHCLHESRYGEHHLTTVETSVQVHTFTTLHGSDQHSGPGQVKVWENETIHRLPDLECKVKTGTGATILTTWLRHLVCHHVDRTPAVVTGESASASPWGRFVATASQYPGTRKWSCFRSSLER